MKLLTSVALLLVLVTGCDNAAKREAQDKLDRQIEEAGGIHRDKDGRPYDRTGKYLDAKGGKFEGPIKTSTGRYPPRPWTAVDDGLRAALMGKAADARALLTKACDEHVTGGCAGLASLDIDKDRHKAEAKLTELCNANDGEGCRWLAYSYETSLNSQHKADDVIALYDKGCTLKSLDACNALGMVYHSGRGGATKDPAKAAAALQRGCDLGDQMSCDQIGMVGGR